MNNASETNTIRRPDNIEGYKHSRPDDRVWENSLHAPKNRRKKIKTSAREKEFWKLLQRKINQLKEEDRRTEISRERRRDEKQRESVVVAVARAEEVQNKKLEVEEPDNT